MVTPYLIAAKQLVDRWKVVYKENGKPHPSSNAYRDLKDSFMFKQGIIYGAKYGPNLEKLEEGIARDYTNREE